MPSSNAAHTNWPSAACVGFLMCSGVVASVSSASAAQWQSPQSIRDAAEQFVRQSLTGRPDVTIQVRGVDERVRLPECSRPLDAYAERPLRNGQGSVSVVCSGSSEWRLFVPVRASHSIAVVVAASSLTRGQRLADGHITLESRTTTSLPFEYLTRLEDALGLTLQRSIPAGTVLVPGALDRPQLVQRGGLVTLIAGAGGIMVKSEGVALEDAALNERVRVKTQVGRVVEGIVEAPNEVRVGS